MSNLAIFGLALYLIVTAILLRNRDFLRFSEFAVFFCLSMLPVFAVLLVLRIGLVDALGLSAGRFQEVVIGTQAARGLAAALVYLPIPAEGVLVWYLLCRRFGTAAKGNDQKMRNSNE